MINKDLNNNGVPDWAESFDRKSANKPLPVGEDNDFAYEYDNEEAIEQYIPNFREYKWYQQPDTKKYYSYGEKLEDKIESGEIAPEQLPEGSDIQKEAEQLYDDSPYNDEVNNEVISKVDFDKMPIDEIEKIDAETINDGKPYMAVANDMGLEEEDLFYFEKPEFIENLTPEQKEEVKKEPDKKKKIELLKVFSRNYNNENIGDIEYSNKKIDTPPIESVTGNSFSINDNPNITSKIRKAGSFLDEAGTGRGSISAGDVSDFSFDDKSDNSDKSVSKTNKAQPNDIEISKIDANTASLNGANSLEHLDNSFDELGFKDTKHNKEIKSNEQADLLSEEFHEKNKESFELKLPENPSNKDIISYLKKDSVNWENGDSKSKYLPFRFFIRDGEMFGTVIGHGKPERIESFMKHEILARGKISNIIKGE